MKKTIVILVACFMQTLIYAQESDKKIEVRKNTVYMDVFGHARYVSLSYDRLLQTNKIVNTAVSGGITLVPINKYFVLGTHAACNFLYGAKDHHLEMGLGFAYLHENIFNQNDWIDNASNNNRVKTDYFYITPKIAYRYQIKTGGVFFKFELTPVSYGVSLLNSVTTVYVDYPEKNAYRHNLNRRVGFSLGYTF